jgi:hypothetical protein
MRQLLGKSTNEVTWLFKPNSFRDALKNAYGKLWNYEKGAPSKEGILPIF